MKNIQKEKELSINLYIKNDLFSAKKLVTSNLKYVIKIAKKYVGYGLNISELIQEGTLGLMKAVKKFNPKKGIKILSFAIHWIKSEMNEYIIKNLRLVKIATTKSQRKLFFNLKNIKKNMNLLSFKNIKKLSDETNIKIKDIIYMDQKLSNKDLSINIYNNCINKKLNNDETNNPFLIIENINFYKKLTIDLKKFIENLNTKCKTIIKKRWLSKNKKTLKELSIDQNVSIERIRQLEKNSLKILQNKINLYN
ncbi:MAG TPA: RNA polymerase factor sigma-32 [Candidatus Azosocius sp. HAIN]